MPAHGTLYVIPTTLGPAPPDAVMPSGTLQVARRLRHFVAETPKVTRQFLKALEHPAPLHTYPAGSWGPAEADDLIAPHAWHLR